MTTEQALSHVERTLNHPAAMRIINYLFERGAIIARRKVTISEMERDLGLNRGYIYRLIVGGKRHRSYLRGFVHYPDKGLREGFYLLPAGILVAIGASPEEIAEILAHRKGNSMNTFRWIIQTYHRLHSHKLPPEVREILKRDNLNLNIAVSRLTRLLRSKTAIKILKALYELKATSWKSATTITKLSKTAGLNKGTVYKLTTRVYPKAKKNHTKSKPPALHGVVHYPQPTTKEGKYYIYPKWMPLVEWLINATEEDIQQLLVSDNELEKIASLFLTKESSFPQVATKPSVTPQISDEFPHKLPIPFSFDSSNNKENLPASSGSGAATARKQLDNEHENEKDLSTPSQPQTTPLAGAVAAESGVGSLSEVDLSTADSKGTDHEIRFRGEEGEFDSLPQRSVDPAGAVAAEGVDDSLSEVDRSTTGSKETERGVGFNSQRCQPQRSPLTTPPATKCPATAAPAAEKEGKSGGAAAGGRGSAAGRRLHYYYVRSDDGEIICKIPYRPKPSQEELGRVWREWFVPTVRARILSFAKLYEVGRCARCLELVGRERLRRFHISWQRRLWRVVKRYGLDSAALQLLAFNKTYVCRECFSSLFIIASLVAGELRRALRKHGGCDVFEPVCMRCGSRCPDCTDREVRWAYLQNRQIVADLWNKFRADFEAYLSKLELSPSVEKLQRELLRVEALIWRTFDSEDYWSWAEWNDYPLGEDEDDWEDEVECESASSDSPVVPDEDEDDDDKIIDDEPVRFAGSTFCEEEDEDDEFN
jgi:hypothetical protein